MRGYPLGGNAQSVTEGVVSRVDAKNYRLGATGSITPGNTLVVQIDAAINGGNSGGPCFDASNRVVGVAFQGIDGAQSIGYIIPASLARTFLASSRTTPKFRRACPPPRCILSVTLGATASRTPPRSCHYAVADAEAVCTRVGHAQWSMCPSARSISRIRACGATCRCALPQRLRMPYATCPSTAAEEALRHVPFHSG